MARDLRSFGVFEEENKMRRPHVVEPRSRLWVYPEDFASGRTMSLNLHAGVSRGIGEGTFRKDEPLEDHRGYEFRETRAHR